VQNQNFASPKHLISHGYALMN